MSVTWGRDGNQVGVKCNVELQPAKAYSMGGGTSTVVLSVVPGPAASAQPGNLSAMQMLSPHPGPGVLNQKPRGWGPAGGRLSALG